VARATDEAHVMVNASHSGASAKSLWGARTVPTSTDLQFAESAAILTPPARTR
jgi:hypothetical protein